MEFNKLTQQDRENILRNNWWGHDGRWFFFVAKEFGFRKANEMNMAINRAVGKLEIKNLISITGIKKITLQKNLLEALRTNLELCAKDVFVIKEFIKKDQSFVLKIDSCAAHSGTEKAGYTDKYECACFKRADGWLEALDANYNSSIKKSLLRGDNECEIIISPGM